MTTGKDVWEIGDLPLGPCAYIRLPPHQFVQATRRCGVGTQSNAADYVYNYSSVPLHTDIVPQRQRYVRQHRAGVGLRSHFHPKTLDYRTVDELGLPLEQLEEHRLPKTTDAKQHAEQLVDAMVVEGAELLRESEGRAHNPSVALTPGVPVSGEIKPVARKIETQFAFYRITVPERDIPVGLRVSVKAVHGDPDVYVCNRNSFPMQSPHEHTWKSQQAGDDMIFIPPWDPLFLPGPFYIGVQVPALHRTQRIVHDAATSDTPECLRPSLFGSHSRRRRTRCSPS